MYPCISSHRAYPHHTTQRQRRAAVARILVVVGFVGFVLIGVFACQSTALTASQVAAWRPSSTPLTLLLPGSSVRPIEATLVNVAFLRKWPAQVPKPLVRPVDVVAATPTTVTPSTAPTAPVATAPSPAPPPPAPSPVAVAPTPVVPAPVSSSGDAMLSEPAWVQAAFACIRQVESNNESWVVNSSSGDGGLYQFNVGTWLAMGGGQFAGVAQDASVAAQDTVAAWTYDRTGFSPWSGDNHCWA